MPNEYSIRLYWIDKLRVLSIFAVIILHTSARVVSGTSDLTSLSWWIGNIFNSSVRWCVPVFVLISGFLLLDPGRDENVSTFFRKRLRRILIPLIFWSLVYILFLTEENLSSKLVIWLLLAGQPHYHLWYLCMILGLFIFTPFLRTYIRSSSHKERYYLIFSILLIASLQSFQVTFLRSWSSNSSIFTMFIPYIGYYLCGYQIRLVDPRKIPIKTIMFVTAGCLLLVILGTGLLVHYFGSGGKGLFLYSFLSPPVILLSVSIFLLAYRGGHSNTQISKSTRTIIERVAPTTLGIYVLHPIALHILREVIGFSALSINPLLSIPLISVITFLSCYSVVSIMLKIPYLRRTV